MSAFYCDSLLPSLRSQFGFYVFVFLFLILSGFLSPITAQSSDSGELSGQRPNILLIFLDDAGDEVLNAYKPDTYDTPRMDELSDSGLTFRHGYSMTQCHPSRIALVTGTYPSRFDPLDWGAFPKSFPKKKSIGHIMKQAGYRTAISGKWQLTLLQDNPDQPNELGFDEYMVFGWHEGPRYWNPIVWENGSVNRHVGKYGPDLYTEFLIDFMRRQKETDQPFFAWYSMTLPHIVGNDWNLDSWSPSKPPPYGPKGRYLSLAEMLTEADRRIGQLVWALEQLGMRENTMIVLTSDNGTNDKNYLAYEDDQFVQGPPKFPGKKGTVKEGGIHVPFVVSWKGTVEPGTTDALVDLTDLLPTFAELAGAKLKGNSRYDGKSFVPVLNDSGTSARDWIIAEGAGRIARNQRWKLYDDGTLYDMKNDPGEQHPVDPEDLSPSEKEQVQTLQKALDGIEERSGSGSSEAG
jgi:arylsulfatase A-like enzyme